MRAIIATYVALSACGGCTEPGCSRSPAGSPPVVELGRLDDPARADPNMREIEVLDLRAKPEGGMLLLLREKTGQRRVVPMVIGDAEGHALGLRMAGEKFTRPLTHDLLETVLGRCGLRVAKVEIGELRETVFVARLYLVTAGGDASFLDARPSDSIVLAISAGAPIYASAQVIDQIGEPATNWITPGPMGQAFEGF